MKRLIYTLGIVFFSTAAIAQEEIEKNQDTTRINLGKTTVLVINAGASDGEDTVIIEKVETRHNEAHWAGVDFGFNVITDGSFGQSFPGEGYLANDIARSQVWNINFLEHKFRIVKEYVGLTTGLGLNFTQIGFDNNFVISDIGDSLVAVQDTMISYKKNKLRATYLTVPLLLEFNTNKDNDKGFYLAAGVIGGYRIGSSYKRVYEVNGDKRKDKQKGGYNLNPFKLDLTARLGYGDFGAFVTYSLVPVFESGATVNKAYPLTAGLTLNF